MPFGATPGNTFALFCHSENTGVGTRGWGGYGEVETFQVTLLGSPPQLTLVKRVTQVGRTKVAAPAAIPNATAPGTSANWFGVVKFRVTVD